VELSVADRTWRHTAREEEPCGTKERVKTETDRERMEEKRKAKNDCNKEARNGRDIEM
jgi:hypothetical protein